MFKKTKVRITFPFCVTAVIFLSGSLSAHYMCALIISLMHEAGHLIAMSFCGICPDSVVFTPTGIKINCAAELISCRAECIVSASGPLVNLILMPFLYLSDDTLPFFINLSLLLINLLPLKSLDAGRFLFNFFCAAGNESGAEKMLRITETAVCVFLVCTLIASLSAGIMNASFIAFTVMAVLSTVADFLK